MSTLKTCSTTFGGNVKESDGSGGRLSFMAYHGSLTHSLTHSLSR